MLDASSHRAPRMAVACHSESKHCKSGAYIYLIHVYVFHLCKNNCINSCGWCFHKAHTILASSGTVHAYNLPIMAWMPEMYKWQLLAQLVSCCAALLCSLSPRGGLVLCCQPASRALATDMFRALRAALQPAGPARLSTPGYGLLKTVDKIQINNLLKRCCLVIFRSCM